MAPSVTGPTMVMFFKVVVVTGTASPSSPLLEPSMPGFAHPAIYHYSPFPVQPSAKSMESSPLPMETKYFPSTVPPKNSMPSSPPLYDWIYSTVVPEPTPKKDTPLNSLVLEDRKSTRLNSSHVKISYAVFCLKKKKKK